MLYAVLDETDPQLVQIIEQVSKGEEVIVMRGTTPIAKFVPVSAETPVPHQLGLNIAENKRIGTSDDADPLAMSELG